MPQEPALNSHYVLILTIEKITKTPDKSYSSHRDAGRWPSNVKPEKTEPRERTELAKIVVRDVNMDSLKIKATKHIELVTDEDI